MGTWVETQSLISKARQLLILCDAVQPRWCRVPEGNVSGTGLWSSAGICFRYVLLRFS